ncbi:Carbohydrate esterase family 4 protein [Paramicrosporidium saccamoebae]|uniref:Carbohydrate esterase family 4 protein n=1 Tax=Paramicrosporidium saccamoebae TaxID=1246581 RepID=A0A2H9TKR8_9FUNG|nr:Carbohydrate esterase family 4 protein [Paramicrosporidium saccamoebae]
MRVATLVCLSIGAVTAGKIYRECQKEGMIAFTFDQGPSQYTGILLTHLAKAEVKATFHIVPDYLDNPVISANLRRAATEGHLIGLYVRDSVTEANVKAYLANATSLMKQYINYQPQFLRFPNPGPSEAMMKTVTALGYKVTSYNLDSQDYNQVGGTTEPNGTGNVYGTIRAILDQIVPPTLGSFICVQRDLVQASVSQTPAILNYVKARGYKAVKLDACIGVDLSVPKEDTDTPSANIAEGGDMPIGKASTSAAPNKKYHSDWILGVFAIQLLFLLVL